MTGRFIYVVEAQNGVIKVGVSQNPHGRAAAIHAHSPVPCRLVAVFAGTRHAEAALHKQFHAQRSHAEWFRIEGPVEAFLNQVRGLGCEIEEWVTLVSHALRWARAKETLSRNMKANWADPDYRARMAAAFRDRRSA